ncbi:MAG: hypothetical protein HQK54_00265 [Oligoflexales bacterium]|nr:hypothetical protein [Oligoflexales bacterium]
MTSAINFLFTVFFLTGCTTFSEFFQSDNIRYDNTSLSIQTINLFNQNGSSTITGRSWKSDWLFRRERLEIIDDSFRQTKPDIIVFQEMLSKKGNPSESDFNILSKSSLKGYTWDVIPVDELSDSRELEYHGVATSFPVSVVTQPETNQFFWQIGQNGYMSLTILNFENHQNILIFNLNMPSLSNQNDFQIYNNIEEYIRKFLSDNTTYCAKRIVIAGYIPSSPISVNYKRFLDNLELKDSSLGFCQTASDCYTGTNLNDLYLAAYGETLPEQLDRILVHRSALISSSNVFFNIPKESTQYLKTYGITKLWPSKRFGWRTTLRFSRCELNDKKPVTNKNL